MSSLYELQARYQQLFDLACDTSDDDGRIAPEFVEILKGLEGQIDDKLGGCWRVLKSLTAQRDVFASEAKRLSDKAAAIERHYESLKAYTKDMLASLGMSKWENGVAKLRIQNNSVPSVIIDDESLLPADAFVQPPPQVDKRWIAEAIKSGKEVPGAYTQTGNHLRVI